ncbi:hypothetical protein Tco_1332381, partial [Tanacetum coccineum]
IALFHLVGCEGEGYNMEVMCEFILLTVNFLDASIVLDMRAADCVRLFGGGSVWNESVALLRKRTTLMREWPLLLKQEYSTNTLILKRLIGAIVAIMWCASCKVFGHIPKECPKNIGVGETKNLKKTSQAPKGILVGPKESKGVGPLLISTSTTPVMDKIGKFENLIIDGQAMLVDEDGLDLALKVCWNNGDYDEDPYDDMYDGQDLSEEVQTICDKLDIRVRGRKK